MKYLQTKNSRCLALFCTFVIFYGLSYNLFNHQISYKTNYDFKVTTNENRRNFLRIWPENNLTSSSFVTVFACYFQFDRSKHNHEYYDKWLKNMLVSVHSPLVIFSDNQSKDFIYNERFSRGLPTEILIYKDVWELMHELETTRQRSYIQNYLNIQNGLDREKSIHNPNLYAVWNLKPFIANKVANQLNPFDSSFFIYLDAGSFRKRTFVNWPNIEFVRNLASKIQDKMLFGQINQMNKNSYKPDSDLIEGTFFSGSKSALKRFSHDFYELHDKRFDDGLFVGKDQTIYNILAFEKYNSSNEIFMKAYESSCPYDVWFFFQLWFAQDSDYKCPRPKFSLLV